MRKFFGVVTDLKQIEDMHEARVTVRARDGSQSFDFVVRTDKWGGAHGGIRRFGTTLAGDRPDLDRSPSAAKSEANNATEHAINLGRCPGPCPFARTVKDRAGKRAPKTAKEFAAVLPTLTREQLQTALDRYEAPEPVMKAVRALLDGKTVEAPEKPKRRRKAA